MQGKDCHAVKCGATSSWTRKAGGITTITHDYEDSKFISGLQIMQ